jgi:hypothetical protein
MTQFLGSDKPSNSSHASGESAAEKNLASSGKALNGEFLSQRAVGFADFKVSLLVV